MRRLLIVDFEEVRYGIWEDAVADVVAEKIFHRIPFAPPEIAGIALFEECNVVIADLGICLGRPARTEVHESTLLVLNCTSDIAGFAVPGIHEIVDCPAKSLLALPKSVTTALVDTALLHGDALIPIVNLEYLVADLAEGRDGLPSPELPVAVHGGAPEPGSRVRVFGVGGASFCVSAEGTHYLPLGQGEVVPLPVRRERLAGITFHDGEVLPVFLLDELANFAVGSEHPGLLVMEQAGERLAFVIDEDGGILDAADFAQYPLPEFAAAPWFPAAVATRERDFLLLDCLALVAPGDKSAQRPLAFAPDSHFGGEFLHDSTTVAEFPLLGFRLAVPKEEVRDDLPLRPILPVPGGGGILLGVARLEQGYLPVLNAGLLFGCPTALGPHSRMLQIENGNFQALVVTDGAAATRRIPLAEQRQVPVALPYPILYGCYLDGDKVRLILNLEAVASQAASMSFEAVAAALAPSLVAEDAFPPGTEGEAPDLAPLGEELVVPLPETRDAGEVAEVNNFAAVLPAAVPSIVEPAEVVEAPADDQCAPVTECPEVPQTTEPAEVPDIEMPEEASANAEATGEAEDPEPLESVAVEEVADGVEVAARPEAQEPQEPPEDPEIGAGPETSEAMEVPEVREAGEVLNVPQAPAVPEVPQLQEVIEAPDSAAAAEEPAVADTVEVAAEDFGLERQAVEEVREVPQRGADGPPQGEESFAPAHSAVRPSSPVFRNRRIRGIASACAILLVLVLFYGLMAPEPDRQPGPVVVPPSGPQPLSPAQQHQRDTVSRAEDINSLSILVPAQADKPATFVYTVKKGDTLWDIAARLTGNPFNYLHLARDNSIVTPDLIFPGQTIVCFQQTGSASSH